MILVVGVNGVGKTTTIGKFAKFLRNYGRSVVVGAADTFRAAAVDQLATWAQRADAQIVRPQQDRQDPASVAFQTVQFAKENGVEMVIIDTAGRLHTKGGLMDELTKIKRVIEKQAPISEVLLVLDATTGQNGLNQAEAFIEHAGVTGLVITKLDGSAKGGFVLAVQERTGIPIKLIGQGEGIGDLTGFTPTSSPSSSSADPASPGIRFSATARTVRPPARTPAPRRPGGAGAPAPAALSTPSSAPRAAPPGRRSAPAVRRGRRGSRCPPPPP